mmetsp:Transcript_33676/g.79409  ORF Transcript_33676/g.79409 Transcript_33676/m.79409 type:complete len:93 (-) Transcript_33676:135-413(-)
MLVHSLPPDVETGKTCVSEEGPDATTKELRRMTALEVFGEISYNKRLSEGDEGRALPILLFLDSSLPTTSNSTENSLLFTRRYNNWFEHAFS